MIFIPMAITLSHRQYGKIVPKLNAIYADINLVGAWKYQDYWFIMPVGSVEAARLEGARIRKEALPFYKKFLKYYATLSDEQKIKLNTFVVDKYIRLDNEAEFKILVDIIDSP